MTARKTRSVHAHKGRKTRLRLRHEALVNAARDLKVTQEWFPLEEEAQLKSEARTKPGR